MTTCLPEIKLKNFHVVYVITWDITYAECGCPADLGPFCSCKHIAALGYALEEYSHIRTL